MSTFIGNGTVLSICDGCIKIIKTNMGKANLLVDGNCNISGTGNVVIYGNNNCDIGNVYINGIRCNRTSSFTSKAIECLECSKYDEKIAETSKATIIRDSTGRMIIVSSSGMDIVNQNDQTFINDVQIMSKNCQHDDINCCTVYYSYNIKDFKNSNIHYSTNVKGENCNIHYSLNVNGEGGSIHHSTNVIGRDCSIHHSTNVNAIGGSVHHCSPVIGRCSNIHNSTTVNGENCKIFNCSKVYGDGCTIHNSSTIYTNNCTMYNCSTVKTNTDNCVYYNCTDANGNKISRKKKSRHHDMGTFDKTDFDCEI